jgi:hypothetical protein
MGEVMEVVVLEEVEEEAVTEEDRVVLRWCRM